MPAKFSYSIPNALKCHCCNNQITLVCFQSLLLLCIYCTPRGWPSVDIQR